MGDRPPHFVIIGAMKCATSTLHDQLARLPGVFMTDPKEPNFFSDETVWVKGEGWYVSLFNAAPKGAICGESSTHYTKLPTHPHAASRLHAFAPHASLIYIMRDPIDRLVSQYIHEWTVRSIHSPIDEAIRTSPELVAYSMYAMQLRPWLEHFGPARVLPVFFERLTARPHEEFERVCRFIGYEGEPVWHDDAGAQNVSSQRMRRHPALDRVLEVRLIKSARRALVPVSVRERIKARWRIQSRPELSEEARAWCIQRLEPDMAELGRMLGIELSCTSFRAKVAGESGPPEWAGVLA